MKKSRSSYDVGGPKKKEKKKKKPASTAVRQRRNTTTRILDITNKLRRDTEDGFPDKVKKLDQLSDDLLLYVFSFLLPQELFHASLVSFYINTPLWY
jgi:hypothetical protein